MPRSHRRTFLGFSLLLVGLATGCNIGDIFDEESYANVSVFATHAGTPMGPHEFPDYGDAGSTRVFTNDVGWEIALGEIYITTAEVRLRRCQAPEGTPIEMFWGPCPEDFVGYEDTETVPLGAVTVKDGHYCGLDVFFGPYIVDPAAEEHVIPENPDVIGHTVYVTGVARRGEGDMLEEIPFSVFSDEVVMARLDLKAIDDGGPIHLDNENYPRNLTVLKTYDTFFDGVDFAVATPEDIEQSVLASLELDTQVFDGSTL